MVHRVEYDLSLRFSDVGLHIPIGVASERVDGVPVGTRGCPNIVKLLG